MNLINKVIMSLCVVGTIFSSQVMAKDIELKEKKLVIRFEDNLAHTNLKYVDGTEISKPEDFNVKGFLELKELADDKMDVVAYKVIDFTGDLGRVDVLKDDELIKDVDYYKMDSKTYVKVEHKILPIEKENAAKIEIQKNADGYSVYVNEYEIKFINYKAEGLEVSFKNKIDYSYGDMCYYLTFCNDKLLLNKEQKDIVNIGDGDGNDNIKEVSKRSILVTNKGFPQKLSVFVRIIDDGVIITKRLIIDSETFEIQLDE